MSLLVLEDSCQLHIVQTIFRGMHPVQYASGSLDSKSSMQHSRTLGGPYYNSLAGGVLLQYDMHSVAYSSKLIFDWQLISQHREVHVVLPVWMSPPSVWIAPSLLSWKIFQGIYD